MALEPEIDIEVAYALPDKQNLIAFRVPQGTTAQTAVMQSGLPSLYPEVDFVTLDKGVFSRLLDGKALPLPQDYQVQAGDRIEVYRPLELDPKQARLLRAARKAAGN